MPSSAASTTGRAWARELLPLPSMPRTATCTGSGHEVERAGGLDGEGAARDLRVLVEEELGGLAIRELDRELDARLQPAGQGCAVAREQAVAERRFVDVG